MPALLCIFLCCFLCLPQLQAQADPCYCLSLELNFYEGAEDFSWVPVATMEQEGHSIQVYKEQNRKDLTAIAVLQKPAPKSSPTLDDLYWLTSPNNSIQFHTAWNFDLKAAHKKMNTYAQTHDKELGDLNVFNFLPPMNSQVQLQVYLVHDYQEGQWPIPKENISMKANVSLPAHPFYADWNPASPFKMKTPYFKINLAYLSGYQWEVEVKDGVRMVEQLLPLY